MSSTERNEAMRRKKNLIVNRQRLRRELQACTNTKRAKNLRYQIGRMTREIAQLLGKKGW